MEARERISTVRPWVAPLVALAAACTPAVEVGPTGPMGPGGIEGPMGMPGSAGPAGLAGDGGEVGPRGDPGGPGPVGPGGAAGPPGPAGTPGWFGITGVQWMTAGGFGLGTTRAVTADCAPLGPGFAALGGGAIAYGEGSEMETGNCHLVWSGPVSALQWRAEAHCDVAVSGGWQLYVSALCGRVGP